MVAGAAGMTASATAMPRVIDEEMIDDVRRRIGIRASRSARVHNEVSSSDSFRHFAEGYGDDNPLYCDVGYGTATSWGSPIAPPAYHNSAGVWKPTDWTDEQRAIMRAGDPLINIGQYMCGERWVFVEPVRPGDVLHREQSLFSAELKDSSLGDGQGALLSHQVVWDDGDNAPYALRYLDYFHADRDKSRKTAKNRILDPPRYSDDDLARIDALYANEVRRGPQTRLAAQVRVGDAIGPIVKGPLTITDVISWHAGMGMGDIGVGALKLAYKNRQRIPGFYQKTETGGWDAAIRAHWDQAWAERLGQPAPYDYGFMRTNWMIHLITNWMGDDAWIWKLSFAVRKFNHMGDVHFISGVVREVDVKRNLVTIDVKLVNQRDVVTADGSVVVILPSGLGEHAELPTFHPDDVPKSVTP